MVANRPAARALITKMYRSVGRISTYKPQNRQEFVTQMNNKAASICKTIELPGDKQPGARFSKVPKTIRARKDICETTNRLFWKADLLTRFQGNKKKNNCEV